MLKVTQIYSDAAFFAYVELRVSKEGFQTHRRSVHIARRLNGIVYRLLLITNLCLALPAGMRRSSLLQRAGRRRPCEGKPERRRLKNDNVLGFCGRNYGTQGTTSGHRNLIGTPGNGWDMLLGLWSVYFIRYVIYILPKDILCMSRRWKGSLISVINKAWTLNPK